MVGSTNTKYDTPHLGNKNSHKMPETHIHYQVQMRGTKGIGIYEHTDHSSRSGCHSRKSHLYSPLDTTGIEFSVHPQDTWGGFNGTPRYLNNFPPTRPRGRWRECRTGGKNTWKYLKELTTNQKPIHRCRWAIFEEFSIYMLRSPTWPKAPNGPLLQKKLCRVSQSVGWI